MTSEHLGRLRTRIAMTAVTALVLTAGVPVTSPALAAVHAARVVCEDEAGFDQLDFWVGEWEVYVGQQRVGTNRIERVLDGCVVFEHWTDARGGEGKSIFYYNALTDTWKQVWVTDRATTPGGLKEKELIERHEDGSVVFRGQVQMPDGRMIWDQTILTPNEDGSVRQRIQVSPDGESWRTTFDARYVRAGGGA